MTKPKKPTIPRQPGFLDESSKQTRSLYYSNRSYTNLDLSLSDLIKKHAERNTAPASTYDWKSIRIRTDVDYGYDGAEFTLEITCDVDVDSMSLLGIQTLNKALLIEWEVRNNLYLEKLRLYEAELKIWAQSEAGLKASHTEQVRKLRAKTNETIDKLAEQLKKRKITPEEFISKMKDVEAIGVLSEP